MRMVLYWLELELTFAKTSGTVIRDRGKNWLITDRRVPSNDPRMNCGTHLGFSPLLVSKWRPMLHSLFCFLVWPYRSSQQFFVPL